MRLGIDALSAQFYPQLVAAKLACRVQKFVFRICRCQLEHQGAEDRSHRLMAVDSSLDWRVCFPWWSKT